MIISDTKEFIFIHNPKTAGTSIRRALLRFDGRQDFYWLYHQSAALGRELDKAHMALDDFRIEFPKDYELVSKYFVFMFVRNPYDRMVSSYNETANRKLSLATTPRAIATYLRDLNKFILESCSERSIRYEFALRFFMPQHAMCGFGDQCVANFVGKVEELERSLNAVRELAQLPADTFRSIEKVNARNKSFRALDLLSRDSIAHVNALYARDFEQFEYAVETPDAAGDLEPTAHLLTALFRRLNPFSFDRVTRT